MLLLTFDTHAQSIVLRATAEPDTNKIFIGGQWHIKLSAEVSKGIRLAFPNIPDSLNHIEVVERTPVDTSISEEENTVTYSQTLTLTAFDPGRYLISPFRFYYLKPGEVPDSIETREMMMTVETIPIDTTKEIRDIKPPMSVPYTWKEIMPYALGVIALLAIVYLIWRLIFRKQNKNLSEKKIPSRPAHEIALEALEQTRQKQLWQQGFFKQYHSEVSDITRLYLEQRFFISALELTTDETLQRVEKEKLHSDTLLKLRYLLTLADIVKFAKAIPLGTENEQAIQFAIDFIEHTRPVLKQDFEPETQSDTKEVGE